MYRRTFDFLQAWTEESQATAKVLDVLSDAALGQKVSENGRTLGKLAWHLVETLPEMLPSAGLKLDFEIDAKMVPQSARVIAETYRRGAKALGEAVEAQWSDGDLETETNMYGHQWARGLTLHVLLIHQAHHRGQMTVLVRQAGLAVPGVCGPSWEEWSAMGMEPQD